MITNNVDLGLAKTNMAGSDFRYIKKVAEPFRASNSALLHLQDIDSLKALDYLLEHTRDTWIILYYNDKGSFSVNFDELFDLWGKLANQLRNIANVAFVNLSPLLEMNNVNTSLSCIGSCPINLTTGSPDTTTGAVVTIDEIHTYQRLPIIKLHRGDQINRVYQTDLKGVSFPNLDYEDTESILRYVMGTFEVDDLAEGSIASMSVDIRRRQHDAMINLQ